MKIRCLNCGKEIELTRLYHDNINPLGFYTYHTDCDASFDIDGEDIMKLVFINNIPKMADFKRLTRKKFLQTHQHITEDEYDATTLYMDWLIHDDNES